MRLYFSLIEDLDFCHCANTYALKLQTKLEQFPFEPHKTNTEPKFHFIGTLIANYRLLSQFQTVVKPKSIPN